MHRLMLTSATYQQATTPATGSMKKDPTNALFGRMNRLRLEGEIIRDSLLAVSGRLNRKAGGPSVFPPIPADQAGPLTLAMQGEGVVGGMNVDARVDPRGLTYYWLNFQRGDRPQSPGTDYSAMRAGRVVVTPLRYDRTDEEAFDDLARKLPKFED